LASRVRQAITFVAIVWGVAATFVAFEIIALGGMDVASSFPALFGEITLSRAVTQSTSCAAPAISGTEQPRPPAAALRAARLGAWRLGVSVGRDAVYRQLAGANPLSLEQMAAGRRVLAAGLGVPAPSVFHPGQLANANTEFVGFVEDGGNETARRLAETASSQACEVFKLGALWGYSEIVRPALTGERAAFAMEIRHHARRAELPEALWSPMLQRVPANAKAEDVLAEMTTLTNGVTTYLTEH
jgi:hypothetical protein